MITTIQLLTPPNGQRQVAVDTDLVLSISSTIPLNLNSLNVRINGVNAIAAGSFQVIDGYVGVDALDTRFITLTSTPTFVPGEQVEISDGYSIVTNTVLSIQENTLKLRDGVIEFLAANTPYVKSINRSYEGTIVSTNLDQDLAITINPLTNLSINKAYLIIVEIQDTDNNFYRNVFTFRTTDTLPPQLLNFPSVIDHSEISFRLVDVLQNTIPLGNLDVIIDGVKAIASGVLDPDFSGSITSQSNSDLVIYLRPKKKYLNNQELTVDINVTDGYNNITFYSRHLVNKAEPLRVEFIEISPKEESILDPRNQPFEIYLRTNFNLDERSINVAYAVNQTLLEEVSRGEITAVDSGLIRTSNRDIYIKIDNINGIIYNAKVELVLFLQEVNEDLEPLGPPFFVRPFHYSSISSTLGPSIDNFLPKVDSVVSPTTQISFRLLSLVDKDPIDISKLDIVVNEILAIDQGNFVEGFTGTITQVTNSEGNAVVVSFINLTPFEIGSAVVTTINAKDLAGNFSTKTFTFPIANTNLPVIIMTPPGGVYNSLIRLRLESDQVSQVYYTTDNTVPEIGKLTTFVGISPITDVPIFGEGLTQVRAFAVNANGVKGSIVTEIYDLNPFKPEIEILSPLDGIIQDITTMPVSYKISLQRGYVVRIEYSLNGGSRTTIENTLTESSLLVTGLRSGTNTISIFATDNAGNTGVGEVRVVVNPSAIYDFTLNFTPLKCPEFKVRPLSQTDHFNDFIDTKTVVIIGYGKRKETLITFALGEGLDGRPVDFTSPNSPDGRHFELLSFPVIEDSLKITLSRQAREIEITARDYVFEPSTGQIVLDHPLETGESLVVEYVSEADQNDPEIFTPTRIDNLFTKHGQPNLENTLSLGAQMAFENGATRVLAVQPLSFLDDGTWFETFKRLEKEEGYWLVPVLNNTDYNSLYGTVRASALGHADKMSLTRYRKEKVVVASRINTESNDFNNARISLIEIDQHPKIRRTIDGETQELNPTFVAACIAGKSSSLPNIALPLTNKNITGFTLASRLRSPRLDQEKITGEGFILAQPLIEGASLYRGRTSSLSSSPILQEVSIQRVSDYLSKNIRDLLEKRFIGQNITPNLLRDMNKETTTYLARSLDIITRGQVSHISVDTNEPRQVNIIIDYAPLFPLNDFNITFTLSTTL